MLKSKQSENSHGASKYKIIAVLISTVILLPSIAAAAGIIPSDEDITKDGFCAFATMINTIIDWFIGMSGVVAAITFSIAGANILLHPDNPEELKKAKSMFTKTIIGMLIVLGAWLVVHTIVVALVDPKINALRFLGSSCN